MPNIPPLGAFGRVDGSSGAPTEVLDAVATQIGETAPRNVLEIWASDATGAKVLVWVRTPDGPASASQSYVNGTPAANGLVRIAITPMSPIRSDSYQIKRPDGSVAGTTSQGATTFDDTSPRPLSGTYTVTAMLAGLLDATPTVTGTLALTSSPASGSATLVDNRGSGGDIHVHLVWTAPTWGKPHQYQIWRNGSFYTTVSGDTLTYDDTGVLMGSTMSYDIYPVLSGVKGPNPRSVSTAVGQDAPTGVNLTNPAADLLRLSWSPPGQYSYFEIQRYDNTIGVWALHSTTTGFSSDWSIVNPGYMRVRALSSTGIASSWVQSGPVTPKPPIVTIFQYINCGGGGCPGHPGDSFYNLLITDGDYPDGQAVPTLNAEYYWSGFPSYGWMTAGASPQTADHTGTPKQFDVFRLQLTPTYARVNQVRNGVASDWNQTGAL